VREQSFAMRIDLGGQPWASKSLSEQALSRFEDPLELCNHLRIRRAELRDVRLPEQPVGRIEMQAAKRKGIAVPVRHRLAKVEQLEIDHNDIESIDGEYCQFPLLEMLDLGFNRIHTITNADMFLPRLRVLILRRNKLSNLHWMYADSPIPLIHLDVSYNQIGTISDASEIANFPELDTLDLSNNPLEGDLTVEAFCMLGCDHLTHLNGQLVSGAARARAKRWCDESEAGHQIVEYVEELKTYYEKTGVSTSRVAHGVDHAQTVDTREARKRLQESIPAARKIVESFPKDNDALRNSPALADPHGYLTNAKVALDHLVDVARTRRYIPTRRPLNAVVGMGEFQDQNGRTAKLMRWTRWSEEMRRLGRRVNEQRGRLAVESC